MEVQWMKLARSKDANRTGVYLPSPENGKKYTFRNAVFSVQLEFRTMDKTQDPNVSKRYVPIGIKLNLLL